MKVFLIENFIIEIKIILGIWYVIFNFSGYEIVYFLFDSVFLYKEWFVCLN